MVTPLNLPTRLTTPPGGSPRTPLAGEPAADMNAISAYIDTVLVPAVNAAGTGTPQTPDPIEVSG
jgi:hypothetical protein